MKQIYYIEELDTYVVAQLDGSQLFVHHVYAKIKVVLEDVYRAFGSIQRCQSCKRKYRLSVYFRR